MCNCLIISLFVWNNTLDIMELDLNIFFASGDLEGKVVDG